MSGTDQYLERSVSYGLRSLVRTLIDLGHEPVQGVLGGAGGYGVEFENDVFMMHPFCWCEQDDCPWCLMCTCPEEAYEYYVQNVKVDFEVWTADSSHGDEVREIRKADHLLCNLCRGVVKPAPNFLHKSSGSSVSWYKYIGRGMEISLNGQWEAILAESIASLTTCVQEDASDQLLNSGVVQAPDLLTGKFLVDEWALLMAIRYGMTRNSYANADSLALLEANLERLSPQAKSALVMDFKIHKQGMDEQDRLSWESLLIQ